MKPVGSLPHSQEPATRPYSEPDQSNPCSPSQFLKVHLRMGLPNDLFLSGFTTKTLI